MNRGWNIACIGFGAALGTVGGAVSGMVLGDEFPGKMAKVDAADSMGAIGAVLGAFLGAVATTVVITPETPKLTAGVGGLRSEWAL